SPVPLAQDQVATFPGHEVVAPSGPRPDAHDHVCTGGAAPDKHSRLKGTVRRSGVQPDPASGGLEREDAGLTVSTEARCTHDVTHALPSATDLVAGAAEGPRSCTPVQKKAPRSVAHDEVRPTVTVPVARHNDVRTACRAHRCRERARQLPAADVWVAVKHPAPGHRVELDGLPAPRHRNRGKLLPVLADLDGATEGSVTVAGVQQEPPGAVASDEIGRAHV